MKNIKTKNTYIPCELCVVEFKVERGFACSFDNNRVEVDNVQRVNFILMNTSQNGCNRNEQYTDAWSQLESYNNGDIWE